MRCATGEIGEALGKIDNGTAQHGGPGGEFEGYTSATDTERKILRDVFEPGDAWFRTGDLMRMDAGGFFYFVDRIGDTFRWKGENVAASEVAAALDGISRRARGKRLRRHGSRNRRQSWHGGAVAAGALNLAKLREHLQRRLPPYARPLFLRLKDRIDLTSTFKPDKTALAREGFDLTMVRDAIYFDRPGTAGLRAARHRAL